MSDIASIAKRVDHLKKVSNRLSEKIRALEGYSRQFDRLIKDREMSIARVEVRMFRAGNLDRATCTLQFNGDEANAVKSMAMDALNDRITKLHEEIEELSKEI